MTSCKLGKYFIAKPHPPDILIGDVQLEGTSVPVLALPARTHQWLTAECCLGGFRLDTWMSFALHLVWTPWGNVPLPPFPVPPSTPVFPQACGPWEKKTHMTNAFQERILTCRRAHGGGEGGMMRILAERGANLHHCCHQHQAGGFSVI